MRDDGRDKWNYQDKVFINEINKAINLTDEYYEKATFREGIKTGFYDLQVLLITNWEGGREGGEGEERGGREGGMERGRGGRERGLGKGGREEREGRGREGELDTIFLCMQFHFLFVTNLFHHSRKHEIVNRIVYESRDFTC